MKGVNWNEIIMFRCSVSSPNEALLHVIRNRVPKRTLAVITGDKPWFDDRCVLAHRAEQRACRVWSRTRTQADWEWHRVARRYVQHAYVEAERAFIEWSRAHQIHGSDASSACHFW